MTVINPLQGAMMVEAATIPRLCSYRSPWEENGGWHPVAEREVRKLAAALSRHSGQEEEEALCHLWGRLGILLQRGNAAILGNRVPTHPVADVNGEQ